MNREEEWLLNEKYLGEKTEGFFTDCARLEAGVPLAYLIGNIPFLDTKISLASRPLIPRAETEYWVGKIIERMRRDTPRARVLDLCAGSGCIGVAILHALPKTVVDFVEIDVEHHSTIAENLKLNDIDTSRTTIIGGDLFENIHERYDVIVTNPPYIDPAVNRAEKSVREHEPHLALYGGTDGLELITHIIEGSVAHLTTHGIVVLEHEPEQAVSIASHARECGFDAESFLDQYGVIRYTVLTRSETENMAP